jgi:tRNA pseudouridine55 synthase
MFILINKPPSWTSHDVVAKLRRITKERTIGHAGTLDPFATGLLIVAIGRNSTKHLDRFLKLDKVYQATIRLGETTDTLDPEGEITADLHPHNVQEIDLNAAMTALTGSYGQIPPMHSAIKKNGKKLYELARRGIDIPREPRPVTIYRFELTEPVFSPLLTPFSLVATIACSSGTYIRSLARDLGEKLGTVAYLTTLRRTQIGEYTLENAHNIEDVTPETWQKMGFDL